MNMDESEGLDVGFEDHLTSYGGCYDDHLPMYGGRMTERELAIMRELDPDFDKTDHGPVIDVDAELAALGYKTEREVLALKVFDPKPYKLIPVGKDCYEHHWKASDLYWLPEDDKSGEGYGNGGYGLPRVYAMPPKNGLWYENKVKCGGIRGLVGNEGYGMPGVMRCHPGIKDKVQTFIKRSREEVGDSFEAFVQYLADYSSTTTAAADSGSAP